MSDLFEHSTPKRVKENPEVFSIIVDAHEARKKKLWSEAEKKYLAAYEQLTHDIIPVDVYSGLAISQRMQKKYKLSESTLVLGMRFFPDNVFLLTELAALKNSLKKWDEGSLLWMSVYSISENISLLNYKRIFSSILRSNNIHFIKEFENKDFKYINENKDILYSYIIYMQYKSKWLFKKFDITNYSTLLVGFSEYSSSMNIQRYFKAYEKSLKNIIDGKPLKRFNNSQLVLEDIALIESVIISSDVLKHESKTVLINYFEQLASKVFLNGSHLGHASVFSNDLSDICNNISEFLKNITLTKVFKSEHLLILANIALLAKNNKFYYYLIKSSFLIERGFDLDNENSFLFSNVSSSNNASSVDKTLLDLKGIDSFRTNNHKFINRSFESYIAGKSVAVVGPVNNGLHNGTDIDSHDIVIRFNYRGGLDSIFFGSKTSISLYADGPIKKKKIDPEVITSINNLDWVVVGGQQQANIVKSISSKVNIRTVFPCWRHNPLYKGTPNAVQKMILDLILHGTSKIKIFNTTLWLSARKIDGYHVGVSQTFESTMVRHDPLFNFIFLKSLYNEGVIQTDDILTDILKMSPKSYIEKLVI